MRKSFLAAAVVTLAAVPLMGCAHHAANTEAQVKASASAFMQTKQGREAKVIVEQCEKAHPVTSVASAKALAHCAVPPKAIPGMEKCAETAAINDHIFTKAGREKWHVDLIKCVEQHRVRAP